MKNTSMGVAVRRGLSCLGLSLVMLCACLGCGTVTRITTSGRIVDQNGAGLQGVHVGLRGADEYSASTDAAGRFDLGKVAAGTYQLLAQGGTAAHYLARQAEVEVLDGQATALGDIIAYRLQGCGVIVESPKAFRAGTEWKKIGAADLAARQRPSGSTGRRAGERMRAIDPAANAAFIYLRWEPVQGTITHYLIYYGNEAVWDSSASHPGDPEPESAEYLEAYLDLDFELADKISTTRQYDFIIAAMNGETEVMRLPAITVSLGLVLGSFPAGFSLDTSHVLHWTMVDSADGYHAQVFWDADWEQDPAADSGTSPLLLCTFFALSGAGLSEGANYGCLVDAHALDISGYTQEITRGVWGFTY